MRDLRRRRGAFENGGAGAAQRFEFGVGGEAQPKHRGRGGIWHPPHLRVDESRRDGIGAHRRQVAIDRIDFVARRRSGEKNRQVQICRGRDSPAEADCFLRLLRRREKPRADIRRRRKRDKKPRRSLCAHQISDTTKRTAEDAPPP